MSQVDVVTKSTVQRGSQDRRARIEEFVKNFEWTWTNAVVFSLALTFFLMIATSVMSSFWMYYAEQKLGWGGPTDLIGFLQNFPSQFSTTPPFVQLDKETLLQIRDAIAMGLTTVPFVAVLVVSSAMQNWRKKLRGGAGEARPSGGYR
jgi:Na+/melibiose symporter-like transporter